MADLVERLVARARVPVPAPRGLPGPSFVVEDDVTVAPTRPATPAPAATPPMTNVAPVAPPPSVRPAAPPRETPPATVQVVQGPREKPLETRPTAQPFADPVRDEPVVARPQPAAQVMTPAPSEDEVEHQILRHERVVERVTELRPGVPAEPARERPAELSTESVTVVAAPLTPAPAVTIVHPRPAPPPEPLAMPTPEPAPPAVHIHVGRVDVRGADEPAPAPAVVPAAPAAPVLSLGDYLHGRADATS